MESKGDTDIISSTDNGMLRIVLNRPAKKNAITIPMYKKLMHILHESIHDNDIYVVVLTGAEKFFSSGNDFIFVLTNQDNGTYDIRDAVNVFKEFIDQLITYPKLLVAVVNGPAIGIAVTMLPLFDMVYASETAYFQTPFTNLGLVAEGCSTYTFPRLFGLSKAGEMLYLGYKMHALEAKQYGLVSEVYKDECLDDVYTYLRKLNKLSTTSILAIKRLVRKWNQKDLLEINAEETDEIVKCLQSSEFNERLVSLMMHKNKM